MGGYHGVTLRKTAGDNSRPTYHLLLWQTKRIMGNRKFCSSDQVKEMPVTPYPGRRRVLWTGRWHRYLEAANPGIRLCYILQRLKTSGNQLIVIATNCSWLRVRDLLSVPPWTSSRTRLKKTRTSLSRPCLRTRSSSIKWSVVPTLPTKVGGAQMQKRGLPAVCRVGDRH